MKNYIHLLLLSQNNYLAVVQFTFIWKLLLFIIAGFVGLIIGAILAFLLTIFLAAQHDRNTPPPEAGSMGGVAWLGIGMVLIFIFSPIMGVIAIYIATLYL